MTIARRLRAADTDDLRSVLALIQREFASMDGVVDPPSSMHRLRVEDLATGPGEVWVIGSPPRACIVMTPKTDVLYVGKVAVATSERGAGGLRRDPAHLTPWLHPTDIDHVPTRGLTDRQ